MLDPKTKPSVGRPCLERPKKLFVWSEILPAIHCLYVIRYELGKKLVYLTDDRETKFCSALILPKVMLQTRC